MQQLRTVLFLVQMLSELEEVIIYKLIPENRDQIKLMWWNRLQVRNANICLYAMIFRCLAILTQKMRTTIIS